MISFQPHKPKNVSMLKTGVYRAAMQKRSFAFRTEIFVGKLCSVHFQISDHISADASHSRKTRIPSGLFISFFQAILFISTPGD
jgi:hypothetical protein